MDNTRNKSQSKFIEFLQKLTCNSDVPFDEPYNWAAVPMELSEDDCQLMWLAWCDGYRTRSRDELYVTKED